MSYTLSIIILFLFFSALSQNLTPGFSTPFKPGHTPHLTNTIRIFYLPDKAISTHITVEPTGMSPQPYQIHFPNGRLLIGPDCSIDLTVDAKNNNFGSNLPLFGTVVVRIYGFKVTDSIHVPIWKAEYIDSKGKILGIQSNVK